MNESRSKSQTEGVELSPLALSARQLSQQIEKMRRDRLLRSKVVNLDEYRVLRQREEPATVLVVDDERALRQTLVRILEQEGYRVIAVEGPEALQQAIEANPFDLVLMDLQLPWINGLEFCAALKSQPTLRDIPVVLLSGRAAKADVRQGFEAGCDEYLVKPVDAQRLVRTVKYMLQG
jgi:CheY-like chemotaxis protein